MRRLSLAVLVLLVAVAFLVSCVGLNQVQDMTPKEKATWMMSVYNNQYDDYLAQVQRPDLTEAQKDVLRTKKNILTEVYPLILDYTTYVESGKVPSEAVAQQIIDKLNYLQTLTTRKE